MNTLDSILSDLREKRLWVLGVPLIVALVVIVVISGSSSPSTIVIPHATTPASVSALPVSVAPANPNLAVAETVDGVGDQSEGVARDPFTVPPALRAALVQLSDQQSVQTAAASAQRAAAAAAAADAAAAKTTSTTTTTPATSTTTPAKSAATKTTTKSATTKTTTTKTPAAKVKTPAKATTTPPAVATVSAAQLQVFHVNLMFGLPAAVVTHDDLARLSALPSAASPLVSYLGVHRDGKTAAFAVVGDLLAGGEGSCQPSLSDCEIINLKPGETELLEPVLGSRFGPIEALEVNSVKATHAATVSAAVQERRRESVAGHALLMSDAPPALADITFSLGSGTLVPTTKALESSAH